jgi:gliding motility-associated-like protein
MRRFVFVLCMGWLMAGVVAPAQAQVSTKGREFWFSYMQMITNGAIEYQVTLSGEVAAQATVSAAGIGFTSTVSIAPGQTTVVNLPSPLVVPNGEGTFNTGVRVTATADISVYATYQSNARTEASLVLPVEALGSGPEYLVASISPEFNNVQARSEFVVVATQDGTTVEIVPAANTVGGRTAGQAFQVTLNRGQTYQVQGTDPAGPFSPRPDLTGSIVRALPGAGGCRPFAVFAGVTATALSAIQGCQGGLSYQHLYEQQFPVATWGTQFALTPYTTIPGLNNRGYPYRILASQNGTTVTIDNGGGNVVTQTLSRGQFYQGTTANSANFNINRGVCIRASAPVAVAQYSLSQACNGSSPQFGDPTLLMLTPLNQATNRVTVSPARMYGGSQLINPQNERHYLNVIMRTGETSQLRVLSSNGSSVVVPPFTNFGACNDYAYTIIPLNTGTIIPSYVIETTGSAGFSAVLYGYNGPDAYAYAAAATFENQEINYRVEGNGLLINEVTGNFSICQPENLTFTGFGSGVSNFTWDFGDGTPTVSGSTVRKTFARPGLYPVVMRATTSGGCGFTEIRKELEIIEVPRPNLGPDQGLCPGGRLTLNPGNVFPVFGGTATYEWSTGATTPTLDVTEPGRYWVRVRNNNQCPASDTIVVNNLAFAAGAGPDLRLCSGQRATLGAAAVPQVTYTWNPLNNSALTPLSATDVAQPTFSFRLTGSQPQRFSYVLTARSANGCQARDTVNIEVLPGDLPAVGRRTVRLCAGETRAIGVANNPLLTYTWAPAQGLSAANVSNPTLTPANPAADSVVTRYLLTISNGGLCTVTDTVEAVVYRLPVAAAGPDRTVCSNDTTRLGTAPRAGATYAWVALGTAPAGALSALNVANPQFRLRNGGTASLVLNYQVTVRGLNNCQARDTVQVTVVPGELPVTSRRLVRLCAGQRVRIGLTGPDSVANPLLRYRWAPSPGLSSDTLPRVTLTAPSPTADSLVTTYVLTIGNGACQVRDTTVAVIYRLPAANAGPDRSLCSGQTVALGAAPVAGLTYVWQGLAGADLANLSNPNQANPNFSLVNTGRAVITRRYLLRATNSFGCTATDTVQLTVAPALGTGGQATRVSVCSSDTVRLGAAALPGYRYSWAPSTHLTSGTAADPVFRFTLTDTLPRSFTYLRTTAFNDCNLTDTVVVTVNPPLPKLRLAGSPSICPGSQNVEYRVANHRAGFAYQWQVQGGALVGQPTGPVARINWGQINPNARVVVNLINNTCNRGGDTLRVDVTLTLRPARPVSPNDPDTLCLAQANNVAYALPNVSEGSGYQWFISAGGRILSGQGTGRIQVDWTGVNLGNPPTAQLGRVWATETITTATNRCFGTTDTLLVLLRPSPSASQLSGPREVCENRLANYSLPGLAGSAYQWTVVGGQVQGPANGPSVAVLWGRAGSGSLTVTETSANACPGGTVSIPVAIVAPPRPQVLRADSLVCAGAPQARTYAVGGQPGSRFTWTIGGGRLVAFNADSSQVTVDWDTVTFPKRLAVLETSRLGCAAATPVNLPVYYDGTDIQIRAVSTQLADDRQVELRFRIVNAPSLPQTFTVERRVAGQGNYQAVGTVQATDTLFTERPPNTGAERYEYRMRRTAQVGTCPTRTGAAHATVLLQATIRPEQVALNWSGYQGWARVARYEPWRRLDDEPANRSLAQLSGSTLTYTTPDGRAGFTQCYRVRAIDAATGRESWSNQVCAELDFPLTVPNVITPNGDGRNDRLVVPNLELYRQPRLLVFNRWGQKIYETDFYRNDWDGSNHPAGMYYYHLLTSRPGRETPLEFKGWVQILRAD